MIKRYPNPERLGIRIGVVFYFTQNPIKSSVCVAEFPKGSA